MQLTDEQWAVVTSPARLLRVHAFAGTGKTSTLVTYAAARPRQRLLYVAFNKSVQLEAKRKFPANVTCRTAHSLAYAEFGRAYQPKLVGSLKPREVVLALDLESRIHGNREVAYLFAHEVLVALRRWLASPWEALDERVVAEAAPRFPADRIVGVARALWERMRDPEDLGIGMLHDGYLKLYQLSAPELPYDIILFDEAQDANPVTADIVLRQSAGKVFVGDAHQQLYAFRGARDALAALPAEATLVLSGSFRFGPNVAELANALLRTYKGERVPIRGLGAEDALGKAKASGLWALVSRGNAAVFANAVAHLARRLYFVGGIEGYRLERIEDAHNLCFGGEVRDPFLRSFADWEEFRALTEATDDRESRSLIRVVERHGRDIPRLVKRVTARAVRDLREADVALMTAHKAKGLEFEQVSLSDDYTSLFDDSGAVLSPDEVDPDEINVLYVAVTRARARLQPNADLSRLLACTRRLHRQGARRALSTTP